MKDLEIIERNVHLLGLLNGKELAGGFVYANEALAGSSCEAATLEISSVKMCRSHS